MRNWGDAVRIWAAFGVGVRLAGGCPPQSGGCHRLPPSAKALPLSAKGLPLSAKTCHHLPQAASFREVVSMPDGPAQAGASNVVLEGCVGWDSGCAGPGARLGSVARRAVDREKGASDHFEACHRLPHRGRRTEVLGSRRYEDGDADKEDGRRGRLQSRVSAGSETNKSHLGGRRPLPNTRTWAEHGFRTRVLNGEEYWKMQNEKCKSKNGREEAGRGTSSGPMTWPTVFVGADASSGGLGNWLVSMRRV